MTDWAGKLAGAVARIAGLLHAAELVNSGRVWVTPIAGSTMTGAIAIGKYLVEHAKAMYAELGANSDVEDAKLLLRWIKRENVETFTKREAHRANRGRFPKVELIEPALSLLEEHGYILQEETERRASVGRKPSPTYLVHPSLIGKD
jgi:hypothetical protein